MNIKKVIFSSILSLVLCLSLIVGGTFALFTSDSKTNIAITSGTVKVKAEVTLDGLYSPTLNPDGTIANEANTAGETFVNGGTVFVDGSEIKITNMTPGDKATFKVTITNSTDVAFLQRLTLGCLEADKTFFNELLIGISDDGENYTYYADFATAWEAGTPIAEGGTPTVETKYVTIEMPGFLGNKWQDNSCTLTLNVVAVQGNAAVTEQAIEKVVTIADAEGVEEAIANAKDGDTVYLSEPIDTLNAEFEDAKTVSIRGYKINTLNVNAPNGTIHVYNDAETINGENVAQHSLYVYGEIASIILNNGRVVIENTAKVEKVELAPQNENAVVKLEAAGSPKVEEVVVNAAAEATVYIATPMDTETAVLPKIEYTETSAVQEEDVINQLITQEGVTKTIIEVSDIKGMNLAAGEILENAIINDTNSANGRNYTGIINLNGDGATLKDSVVNGKGATTWDAAVSVRLKSGEIAYITNVDINGGFRGIFLGSQSGSVIIDGCTINPVAYVISVDGGGDFSLTVKNSTLKGWLSYSAIKSSNFENCTFASNGSYAFYRPYSATTLTNCNFEAGYEIDTQMAAVTLIGCTINGTALTAENAGVLFEGGIVPENVTIK